ncbi:glycosyl hydrolases family 15 domain-containing protein [Ditylenchus destructor]|nr:glycosyl hydrolases family 15 domain-containing protein [Ditylenchus destructor]
MRARSHSGVRLDQLMILLERTILIQQDPVTGLFANNPDDFPTHAWIRDNVYAVQAIWAMYRAYQKSAEFDEDLAKARELGLTCVKTMQSLLDCMVRQVDKIERFKMHQRSPDSLHAKYSVRTKATVVGDSDWGHLQIDAISLYLLILAQMTASGLQVVRNFDEVAFVQNLVYYIETGYRTPDFGVWERGDKTNQGICELNASSIGMAKAALQALNDVGDLFGDGSKGSIIHVLPDEIQQCSAALNSMLPRESFSKETDAALLSIIAYPAFSVEDLDLVELTRTTIMDTLYGRYGCRRFLRDGYKNALEDPHRLYYINAELQKFENIECEWPIFICYLFLDAMFRKDEAARQTFWKQLQSIVLTDFPKRKSSDPAAPKYNFIQLLPELYVVPIDRVELERVAHGSQDRVPSGTTPFLWAQSLYILCCLLHDGFLTPAELDPLSRRLSSMEKRPPCEVQVVLLAESIDVQRELAQHDIKIQLVSDIDPMFSIQPASTLRKILNRVGQSSKLNLSGRPLDRDVELLSTSKLYHLGQKFVVFTPQFMDRRRSHIMYDIRILMDEWSSELQYIYMSWNSVSISGRPLVALVLSKNMLQTDSGVLTPSLMNRRQRSTVLGAIKKIKNGYIGGARVVMKNLSEFFRTTSVSKLELHDANIEDFLTDESSSVPKSLPQAQANNSTQAGATGLKRGDSIKDRWSKQYKEVHQASMRHRSIALDSNDADLLKLRLAHTKTNHEHSHTKQAEQHDNRRLNELKEEALFKQLNNSIIHTFSDTRAPSYITIRIVRQQLTHSQLESMQVEDLVDMLHETSILDEQASLIHLIWMKMGPNFDTKLNGVNGVTVRMLTEELYTKACESRDWAWVRLTAGLLRKQLDELSKAVTHLLVRQKQITVGLPSKKEEAITCPKTKDELREILNRCFGDDPNSYTLAQELIVSLGSLVRTEPRLFVEMFRLRIGLIIQILASELQRLRNLTAEVATQQLLAISPFELKCMLFSILSGRLLEDFGAEEDAFTGGKELRTGMGSFRKQIEERKSMRKSMRARALSSGGMTRNTSSQASLNKKQSPGLTEEASDNEYNSENDASTAEDFQFGIWLRHRRIDGALNRVPPEFYANLWDTVRLFPHGISINRTILHRSLTQEMTRREIKFALQVEQLLNQISEPEYREIIVEALTLMGRLDKIILAEPKIPTDRPFEIERVVEGGNKIFVEQNKMMGTIVLDCCASQRPCDGARGICKHFYDTAPAGEFGTAHCFIKAIMDIFSPE